MTNLFRFAAGGSSRSLCEKYLIPVAQLVVILSLVNSSLIWKLASKDLPETNIAFGTRDLGSPDPLRSFHDFRKTYRSLTRTSTGNEFSRRQLIFNADLIEVGLHNCAFISGLETYIRLQSPLSADRLPEERLANIHLSPRGEAVNQSEWQIDNPVGANLETGGQVDRWFTRLVRGDSFFEIPDYPLDAQPNPEKITHIDSDLRYCTGKLHNQGSCGACYAFSWNTFAEWHYCSQTGTKIDLSEQHIVDCGGKAQLRGCIDGYLRNVKTFSELFGFHPEKEYPYRGKEGSCNKAEGPIRVKVENFRRLKVDRLEWERVLNEQPILLEVHLPSDILSYKRGVHPGDNCNSRMAHGMVLVGHGRQDGAPYWLLKNSMGEKWGENGFLRLSRDAPMDKCFRTGFVAQFKYRDIPDEKYHMLYDSFKYEPTIQSEEPRKMNSGIAKWLNE